MKLKIEYIPVDQIKPYEGNAKLHPAEQVEQIKESIRQFGFNDPIAIWNGEIVEGHGRYMAANELGIDKVPVIRLDGLTDEQRRAYGLIHNKLTMNSDFDPDLLQLEIDGLEDVDMTDFGFEFVDEWLEHEKNAETTQERVEKILNLDKASYPGAGDYDIPIIKPVYSLPPIREWIGFNYVLSDDDPKGKAVHFFIDDYQFERIWNDPDKYVDKLRQYACVATPDFSPYADMPLACQLFNHYRKHWVGAFLQANFTGMSDKPAKVSDSQLDTMKGVSLYRTVDDAYNRATDIGYTSRDIAKQVMDGDFTMYSDSGGSAHGKAIYFASNYTDSSYYGTRGKNPVTMRAKITGGKSIKESTLDSMYYNAVRNRDKLALACSNAGGSSARNLYGLAKGYDVITPSGGSNYYMVLNRRCLTMSTSVKKTKIGGSSW